MKNLLHEFFNSQPDASLLEASQQEKMEVDFEAFQKAYFSNFENAARPLMFHLGTKHHPHTSAYVRNDVAELLEGQKTVVTQDYSVD